VLAAAHVLPLAVKDGNLVASAALLRSLRQVSDLVKFGQTETATGVLEVPQA
jgi:hypothetical protein